MNHKKQQLSLKKQRFSRHKTKGLNLIINNNDNAYEKELLSIGTFIVICYSSKL